MRLLFGSARGVSARGVTRALRGRRSRRGAALIIALALTLCLTMVVVGTQIQVVTQLKQAKGQRDYDRALEMAEAGANAYLNFLSGGNCTGTMIAPWDPATTGQAGPPSGSTAPSLSDVRSAVLAGTIPVGKGSVTIAGTSYGTCMGLVNYPVLATQTTKPGLNSQTGYFVFLVNLDAATVKFVSYGYSNGIVRRVQVGGSSSDIFDWAAVYGLDSQWTSGQTDYAWNFTGSANVVGASGAEGKIIGNNNVTWYDGPIILAANGNVDNADPSQSQMLQSTPNVPTGHTGTGTLANPFIRRLSRSLNIETADVAAQRWAATAFNDSTATSVNYFRTHNNNATGIRVLVKVTKTTDVNYGKVRELPSPYVVPTVTQGNDKAYQIGSWANLKPSDYGGVDANETFYGLRFYPGNYFFEAIGQSSSDVMYLRSYADGNAPTTDTSGNKASFDSDGVTKLTIWKSDWSGVDPANPNSGMSAEKNIRFWLGTYSGNGSAPNTTFNYVTYMENPSFASRFRVYSGIVRGTSINVKGTNANPPPKFRVNLLGYNKDGSGFYGSVSIESNVYLFGSLIGWQVSVSGGATIEKQAAEGQSSGGGTTGQNTDRIAYGVTSWTELP